MTTPPDLEGLPPWMAQAFVDHGFTALTPVQQAVLQPETAGRDLRIASATGSGKTVALAMAVADDVLRERPAGPDGETGPTPGAAAAAVPNRAPDGATDAATGPTVLVVAPTRELAAQLQGELRWVYAPVRAHVALVTGGGAYGQELRALRRGPALLVGTPGRLVDHLQRGSLDLSRVATVVLDEADQLLELGFKDELDAILTACPADRRTLMVSATFGGAVKALADRHQRDPLPVQGTPTGGSHADIEHVVHPIAAREQVPAIANVLLTAPEGRAIVFVAMRAQASELSASLGALGFDAAALSGELSQAERSRTLDALRRGALQVLVATDVAARGIDVQDIRTVVHACPPRDAEALIHRSGRTGRAGQRGRSVMLCTAHDAPQVRRILSRGRVSAQWLPVPGEAEAQAVLDERLMQQLQNAPEPGPRARALAATLLSAPADDAEPVAPEERVARLLEQLLRSEPRKPQPVTVVDPERRNRRKERPLPERTPRGRRTDRADQGHFAAFEVNWGRRNGATPPRLLAMLCRRGRIERRHIGHIDVLDQRAVVEVDTEIAEDFLQAMRRRDSRDRHIRIRPVPARAR